MRHDDPPDEKALRQFSTSGKALLRAHGAIASDFGLMKARDAGW